MYGGGNDKTQHGAPPMGKLEPKDVWSSIICRDNQAVVEKSLISLQTQSYMSALKVLECKDKKEVIMAYSSLIGYTGGRFATAAVNPFIPVLEDRISTEELLETVPALRPMPTRLEVEELLRTLVRSGLDIFRSNVFLLNVIPERWVVNEIRLLLSRSLEGIDQGKEDWIGWRNFSARDPSTLSPNEIELVQRSYERFAKANEVFFNQILECLQRNCSSEDEDPIEKHRKWKDQQTYFKSITSREEPFDRERMLFQQLTFELVSWETRREFLNQLLSNPKLAIPTSIIDHFLLDLTTASDYNDWMIYSHKILQWCKTKERDGGDIFNKKEMHSRKGGENHTEGSDKRDTPNLHSHPKPTTAAKWCSHCRKKGHNMDECFQLHPKESKSAPLSGVQTPLTPAPHSTTTNTVTCWRCKEVGHYADTCPLSYNDLRQRLAADTTCFKCQQKGHYAIECPRLNNSSVTPPAQLVTSSSSSETPTRQLITPGRPAASNSNPRPSEGALPHSGGNVGTTKFGRPVRPVKKYNLVTVGENQDIAVEAEEDAEEHPLDYEEEVSSSVTEENPHAQTCLRTVALDASTLDVGVPSVCCHTESSSLLEIVLRVDTGKEELPFYRGLLDTGSNLNYVTASVVAALRQIMFIKEEFVSSSFVVQTMSGCASAEQLSQVELNISLCDSNGDWTIQKPCQFLVYNGNRIPGGTDFLLASDWIISEGMQINGSKSGYTIRINTNVLQDKATQAEVDAPEEQNLCCHSHSIAFSKEDETEDEHFKEDDIEMSKIVMSLEDTAVGMGPLTRDELDGIRFPTPELELPLRPGMEHPPIREEGYPAPDDRVEQLLQLIDILEKQGILEEVPRHSGQFLSPGFGVKKPNGKIRLVVNLQNVNSRLLQVRGVHFHDAKTWIDSLPSWGNYFACMDVKDAFYSIPVSVAAQKLLHMSIYTKRGYREYRWKRMPQGLSVSPSWWCDYIENCIRAVSEYLEQDRRFAHLIQYCKILVYADDILIIGREEEHVKQLSQLLHQTLLYNKLYIPEDKFQRCAQKVLVMGLEVSAGEVRIGEKNVEKIRNLTRPANRKQLESAIGLLGYTRWSLNDREGDHLLHVLYSLRDSSTRFHWGEEHQAAWNLLVTEFNNLPLKTISRVPGEEDLVNKSLLIQTDASNEAIGYACFVMDTHILEGEFDIQLLSATGAARLVSVGSRKLKGSERHYVPHDKEALGIFHALSKNRKLILLFDKTLLMSDNKTALSKLKGKEKEKVLREGASTTRGRRWLRWMTDLSDLIFPFEMPPEGHCAPVQLIHVRGIHNNLADYLSRYVYEDLGIAEASTQTDTQEQICLATTTSADQNETVMLDRPVASAAFDSSMNEALKAWENDDSLYVKKVRLADIWLYLEGREPEIGTNRESRDRTQYVKTIQQLAGKRFDTHQQQLYIRQGDTTLVVIPKAIRDSFLAKIHDEGPLAAHRGERYTLAALRRFCWWPGMDRSVHNWIQTCLPCQISKARMGNDFNSYNVTCPNHVLYADWAGPLSGPGCQGYVLLLVDSFSGYCMAFGYDAKSALNTADALLSWSSLLGTPQFWSSDNDSTFVSQVIRELRLLLQIKDLVCPAYTPTTQGVVERRIGDLKSLLARFQNELSREVLLRKMVWSANTSPYTNALTPFEIMLGRKPHDPFDMALRGCSLDNGLRPEETTLNPYIERLQKVSSEIQQFWSKRLMESRLRSIDNVATIPQVKLQVGDVCLRVIYQNGRREILHVGKISKEIGRNSFEYIVGDEPILAHGYQLVRLNCRDDQDVDKLFKDYEDYYEIERVVRYEPQKGYLVHWKGYPALERSWQHPRDMPTIFALEMKEARKKYRETPLGGSVVSRSGVSGASAR